MNIKQAESLSGISKRNIRYYEQEGMLHPTRNLENDYREYTDSDIRTLKLIRALRMLDMPLEQIRKIIDGQIEIGQAAAAQEQNLRRKAQELDTAIRFCREFQHFETSASINIDEMLKKMDTPENHDQLFTKWVHDYKKVSHAQHQKVFTFLPDDAVTTSGEFTLALCRYARENNLDLVITKESMYPEFTIDGIEYTAERFYTRAGFVPVATIRCTAVHPEELEPQLPKWETLILKAFHYSWLFLILILLNINVIFRPGGMDLFSTWQGWVVFISILLLSCVGLFRTVLFFYNHKTT